VIHIKAFSYFTKSRSCSSGSGLTSMDQLKRTMLSNDLWTIESLDSHSKTLYYFISTQYMSTTFPDRFQKPNLKNVNLHLSRTVDSVPWT